MIDPLASLSSSSTHEVESVDRRRVEMPWGARSEKTIELWKEKALSRANIHEQTAYNKKKLHKILGIIAISTPLVFAICSQFILEGNEGYFKNKISAIGFSVSSIVTGIFTFLNLETAMFRHFEYAAKYEEYAIHLMSELTKPKAHRTPCDVFLKECELRLIFIEENAPS